MAELPENVTVKIGIKLDAETQRLVESMRNEYSRLAELPDTELAGLLAVLAGVRKPAAMRAWDSMRGRWRDHEKCDPANSNDRSEWYRYGWDQGFAAAAQILADELRIPEDERTWIGEALS